MNEPGPVLVGVDFTVDELRLLMTELDGEPLLAELWPLPPVADEESWAFEVGGRIASLFAREGSRRSAIGITVASPGTVDPVAGRLIHCAAREDWDGLPVVEALRRHIDAPISAVNRVQAALTGEAWQGAAVDVRDAIYVELRGVPSAAAMVHGRLATGAGYEAGGLPAMPEVPSDGPLDDERVQAIVGLLADAAALLNPALVVLEGEDGHIEAVLPPLQQVIDEVAPGPRVLSGKLGRDAAVFGAIRFASTLAYEGGRDA